ncbi:hypothetical protein BaRGS_00008055 [Batillaria attramentaria]|uniref:EF-hand domain-containing protein n=1 Tax=Batillaria attramentaria TaxID=370345 RepID=A0ABD0LNJ8_9CAEN|nr:hypothetical protein BaRGS_029250 [Batillaria attramentaria]
MAKFDEQCKRFFEEADLDGKGTLSKLELAKVLKKVGVKKTPEEIIEIFDDLDRNDDDQITLDEFMGELGKIDMKDKTDAELRRAFQEIDADGSGYITLDELKAKLAEEGIDPDGACLDLDVSGDGKVNFEEFLDGLRNK